MTWLREQRERLGLSYTDIASETGLTRHDVAAMEDGRRFPPPHRWGDVALAYGVEVVDVGAFFEHGHRRRIEAGLAELVANTEHTR